MSCFHTDCVEIPLEFGKWLPVVTHRCRMSKTDAINKHHFSWNSFWRIKKVGTSFFLLSVSVLNTTPLVLGLRVLLLCSVIVKSMWRSKGCFELLTCWCLLLFMDICAWAAGNWQKQKSFSQYAFGYDPSLYPSGVFSVWSSTGGRAEDSYRF